MFTFVKSLFRGFQSSESVSKSSTAEPRDIEKSPPASSNARAVNPAPKTASPGANQNLTISLRAVVEKLPPDLRSQMLRQPGSRDVLPLPLAAALAQLPSGAVKIPLGELKKAAPTGLFAAGCDVDATLVELPLGEILSQLKPTYLNRRPDQKRVVVPEGIGTIFASQHHPDLAAHPPTAVTLPESLAQCDDLRSSQALANSSLGINPPSPVPVAPVAPAAPAVAPPAPVRPAPTVETAPSPAIGAPSIKTNIPASLGAVAPNTSVQTDQAPVKVALAALARNWPEPTRRELLAAHGTASINIPFSELEAALARGKAIFTWEQIRLWLAPKPALAASHHDSVTLELPLSVDSPNHFGGRGLRCRAGV